MIYDFYKDEQRKMKTGEEFISEQLSEYFELCGDYISVCQRRLAPNSYNDIIEDKYWDYMLKGREYFNKIKELCDEMIAAIEEEKEYKRKQPKVEIIIRTRRTK